MCPSLGRGAVNAVSTVDAVEVIKQVLAHERARMQVGYVEVGELRPEPFLQVGLGLVGQPPQVPQAAAELAGYLRQLVGPEYHQRQDGQH